MRGLSKAQRKALIRAISPDPSKRSAPKATPPRLSVIGTGYVGLVTGACLAVRGIRVTCVDVVPSRVEAVNRGEMPFHEPGMDDVLRRALRSGRLKATTDLASAVRDSDITMIAVGTPDRDGKIDLSYVTGTVRQCAAVMKSKRSYHVLTVKSTVVPGTTDSVVLPLVKKIMGSRKFGLCINPEFLREGCAVEDFSDPDRVVIGALDDRSYETFAGLYTWVKCPVLRTSLRTAEMIKYTSNSLLATLISFSNEIASIGEGLGGVEIQRVFEGLHLDRRLTPFAKPRDPRNRIRPGIITYLWPGCGFGGSCLPKDVKALKHHAKSHGVPTPVLASVLETNANQPKKFVAWAKAALGSLKNKRIAVWGLAFKPDTDDLRESPALIVVRELVRAGAKVTAYDPIAMKAAAEGPLKGLRVTYAKDLRGSIKGADALFLMTAWKQFRSIPPQQMRRLMRRPLLIDGRLFFDPSAMRAAGFDYRSPGSTDRS